MGKRCQNIIGLLLIISLILIYLKSKSRQGRVVTECAVWQKAIKGVSNHILTSTHEILSGNEILIKCLALSSLRADHYKPVIHRTEGYILFYYDFVLFSKFTLIIYPITDVLIFHLFPPSPRPHPRVSWFHDKYKSATKSFK